MARIHAIADCRYIRTIDWRAPVKVVTNVAVVVNIRGLEASDSLQEYRKEGLRCNR